ncbi:hypothetical protein A7M48_19575 [Acinetobacter baumannii]|nr:hypothetical protein A7M48_19575 [Acinetobacter baumannii]
MGAVTHFRGHGVVWSELEVLEIGLGRDEHVPWHQCAHAVQQEYKEHDKEFIFWRWQAQFRQHRRGSLAVGITGRQLGFPRWI